MRTIIAVPVLLRWYLVLKNRVILKSLSGKVRKIALSAERLRGRSDDDLADDCQSLKDQVERGATPEQLELDLFALICEQADRRLGMRPYDVQLLAALMLRRGKVIQMETGEGKTLVAPFHAIMEAVFHRQVTIVAPNDYLSFRDAQWMRPLYDAFGISVSAIQPDDSNEDKQEGYRSDVVYVSTASLVFDWLRTQHSLTAWSSLPISRETVIIDEIDAVLLDQAVSSYSLANPIDFRPDTFAVAEQFVQHFSVVTDFEAKPKMRTVEFTDAGFAKSDELSASAGLSPADGLFYIRAALAAHHLYQRDRDYIVESGEAVPLDDQSGRPLHGSKFEFGVQQAIDQKEGISLSLPNTSLNQITLQSFFSSFRMLSGMSGSAIQNALEFKYIYGLDVIPIPPNRRCIRVDGVDVFYITKAAQLGAVVNHVEAMVESGRPVLVGTTNIQDAEAVGELCTQQGVDNRVLSAKNYFAEAVVIAEAGQARRVTIAARMAGRGVDIRLDEPARLAGGLHVIGVGRSEARRLDEQLIGRSGRQGDPGSSIFILSLEDDLLASLGGDATRKLTSRWNLEEAAEIRSRVVTRAIRRAQRQLVLHRFAQRQAALQFDRYLNASRETVFRRRATLLEMESYDQEIENLIVRYLDRLGHVEPEDLNDQLADIGRLLSLHVPLGVHAAGERGAWKEELSKTIRHTYVERRARAEPYAVAREHLVFLRSIDFSWSLFLDKTTLDFDSLLAVFGGRSRIELQQELHRHFLGAADRLHAEIDETTLRFLLRLDNPVALQDIKFWRGLGLVYGGPSDIDPEDGLGPPPDYLMTPAFPGEEPSGTPPPQPARPLGRRRQGRSELINAYTAYMKEGGISQRRLRVLAEVVDEFLSADDNDSRVFTVPLIALDEHLAELKARGHAPLSRHGRRRIILQFLKYLSREGMLAPQARVSPGRLALDHAIGAIRTLMRPSMVLQVTWVVVVFVAYRWLSGLSVPGVPSVLPDGEPVVSFPSPTLAYQLIDQLVLAGAVQAVTLGMIGAVPLISTELLLARFGRQSESPALYVPLALVLSVVAGPWLLAVTRTGEGLDWPALAVAVSSLFVVSCIVTLLIWTVRYVDFITGLELVLFGNALVVAWQLWEQQLERPGRLVAAGLLLGGFMLTMLRIKMARVSVELLHTGKFDLKTGRLTNVAAKAQISLLPGSYHLLAAFLLVLVLGQSVRGLKVSVLADVSHTGAVRSGLLGVLGFLCLALWLSFKRSNHQLSRTNIAAFLRGRDLFVARAAGWDGAVTELRRTVRRRLVIDAAMEAVIILVIWLGIASVSSGLPWQHSLYLLMLTLFVIQMLVLLGQRVGGSLRESSTIGVLAIQAVDEDEGSWLRRRWRALMARYGLLGLVGVILGIIAAIRGF